MRRMLLTAGSKGVRSLEGSLRLADMVADEGCQQRGEWKQLKGA